MRRRWGVHPLDPVIFFKCMLIAALGWNALIAAKALMHNPAHTGPISALIRLLLTLWAAGRLPLLTPGMAAGTPANVPAPSFR